MTFNDQHELLDFLVDVSLQLENFLDFNPHHHHSEVMVYKNVDLNASRTGGCGQSSMSSITDEQQQQSIRLEEEEIYQAPRYHHVPQGGSWEECRVDYNNPQAITRTMYDLVNQASYASTHHYVPSTSTNFVNLTQYSAKPPQRQDTGYAYLINDIQPTPLQPQQQPPPPPLMTAILPQDYQPSNTQCAYCYWLATTSSASTTVVPSVADIATVSNDNSGQPGVVSDCCFQNYAYPSG